jgi:hypothetical protein
MFGRLAEVAREGSAPRGVMDLGIEAGATMLSAHHDYEEDLLLPLLRAKGAEGPWDRIHEEHGSLTEALEQLRQARGGRADLLEALHREVVPHMEAEEEVLTEAFWRDLLTTEEARAFGKQIAAHSRAHLTPSARMLPLVLYNLDPEERAAFTAPMPSFVVRGLVPYVFRASWRPLRPFMAYPPRRLSPLP